MLLIILLCAGPALWQGIIQSKMSIVSRLRDPDQNQTPTALEEVTLELLQLLPQRANGTSGGEPKRTLSQAPH